MKRCAEDELIARYVEPHPWKGGKAEARLRDSKVSIWALAGYLREGEAGIAPAATAYGLPREAVEAALEYYRRNKKSIDARMIANEVR